MTNAQLYLAIGLPALVALTNTALIFFLSGRMDARFDKIDARSDKMDARLDRLESRVDARFDRVDADLRQFYSILGAHGKAIEILEKK